MEHTLPRRVAIPGKGYFVAVIGLLSMSLSACTGRPSAAPQIHQVSGDANDVFANAYIIEGELGLVVVDSLLTGQGSRALRQRVDAFGKPLLAVVITHGHPDHYGGVAQLVEGLEATPVVALAGVDGVIRRDDAMRGERLKALGIDWADTRTFPNVVANHSVDLSFGDISLAPIDIGEAESDHDSAWVLRTADGEHAFVGDLVMNDLHAYTSDAHTGPWLDVLTRMQARFASAIRIYPGHGPSGGIELFRSQARYLERLRSDVRELSEGRASLSAEQITELETRMIGFLGHDRMARWIREAANALAEEVNSHSRPSRPSPRTPLR